ncbi:MAG: hypothetical protein EP330_14145 [Deltaproteobacteria bacterium]|nr:MAG: hypothetical protein EP330_14145 [Deltaproteobacteria bacterium]
MLALLLALSTATSAPAESGIELSAGYSRTYEAGAHDPGYRFDFDAYYPGSQWMAGYRRLGWMGESRFAIGYTLRYGIVTSGERVPPPPSHSGGLGLGGSFPNPMALPWGQASFVTLYCPPVAKPRPYAGMELGVDVVIILPTPLHANLIAGARLPTRGGGSVWLGAWTGAFLTPLGPSLLFRGGLSFSVMFDLHPEDG